MRGIPNEVNRTHRGLLPRVSCLCSKSCRRLFCSARLPREAQGSAVRLVSSSCPQTVARGLDCKPRESHRACIAALLFASCRDPQPAWRRCQSACRELELPLDAQVTSQPLPQIRLSQPGTVHTRAKRCVFIARLPPKCERHSSIPLTTPSPIDTPRSSTVAPNPRGRGCKG